MLVIRFFRVGKKNQPSFKIVVTDKKRAPCGGRFIEEVGFYNPLTKEKVLKKERLEYWLSVGAKPSDTVYNLLVSEKIIEGKKIPRHLKKKKSKGEEEEESAAKAKEEPVKEEPAKEDSVKEEPAKEEPVKEEITEQSSTEEKTPSEKEIPEEEKAEKS